MPDDPDKKALIPPQYLPSASTTGGTLIGGAAVTVFVWAADAFFQVQVPPLVAGAFGVLFSQFSGLFFKGGTKATAT